MSESEAELGERDPRSLLAEADYWRAILADLKGANEAVLAASSAVCEVPISMLELLMLPDPTPAIERARAAAKQALDALEAIGGHIEAIGDLAGGRLVMLRREGGLEP